MGREYDLVELVTLEGVGCGTATVAAAHKAPGLLHRAFSVLLLDDRGQTLTQQRAATKSRFAGRWANACCGHPLPGESPIDAASRRLAEELGITGVTPTEVGVYVYAAEDAATGAAEREYDHVLIASYTADQPIHPDPEEVSALRWVPLARLAIADLDPAFAPWLSGVVGAVVKSSGIGTLS